MRSIPQIRSDFALQEQACCQALAPWLLGALLVSGACLAFFGSVALPVRLHDLPWGFLQHIPMDQSILMISIGALGTGAAIVGLARKNIHAKPELDKTLADLSALSDQFRACDQQKLYYFPQMGLISKAKGNKSKDEKPRFTLIRLADGTYHVKTDQFLGEGKRKKSYLGKSVLLDSPDQVRTVEQNPPVNDELVIYEALRDCPYVVHCLQVVKDTPTKRSLILEYCAMGELHKAYTKLSYNQLLQAFHDYMCGLGALHRAGYLHLDCHGGNLFLMADGSGRLADFGSCRRIDALNTPEGFARFMPVNGQHLLPMANGLLAPEIVARIEHFKTSGEQGDGSAIDLPLISGKADVWALGYTFAVKLMPKSPALLHIRACKEKILPQGRFSPFGLSPEQIEAYLTNLHQDYPPEPNDQNSLEYLLWRMLHPHPEARFSEKETTDFISTLQKMTLAH